MKQGLKGTTHYARHGDVLYRVLVPASQDTPTEELDHMAHQALRRMTDMGLIENQRCKMMVEED